MLTIACLLLFAPALDAESQFLYSDSGRMHFPTKAWIAQELSRGHLPQWNPYAGTGVPVIATGVDSVLHPLNLFLVVLPFAWGFKAWVLASVLGAGLGALLWARRLGATGSSPLLAGAAFMATGFVVSYTDNLTYLATLAAAPWLLAAGHAYVVAGGPVRLAGLALASLLCATAGDPMGWGVAVTIAAALPFLGAVGHAERLRSAVVLGVGVAAAAPVVLPMAMWIPHSQRAVELTQAEYLAWSLAPWRLLEFVVPGITRGTPGALYNPVYEAIAPMDPMLRPWVLSVFVGAPVVALAVVAGARHRVGRVLLAGAVAAIWMAMGHHAGFGAIARTLPLISRFRYWEKLAAWPALFLAVAAAIGTAVVLADLRVARRLSIGAGVGAAVLMAVAAAAAFAPDSVGSALGTGARGAAIRAEIAANVAFGSLHSAVALVGLAAVAWATQRGRLRAAAPFAIAAVIAGDLGIANRDAYVLSPASLGSERVPLADAARSEVERPRVITPFDPPRDRFRELREFESQSRVRRRILGEAWNVAAGIGNFDAYTGLVPSRLSTIRTTLGPHGLLREAGMWGFSLAATPADAGQVLEAGVRMPIEVVGEDPEVPAWLVRIPHRPRAFLAREVDTATFEEALRFVRAEPPESGRSVVEGPVPAPRAVDGVVRIVADDGERVVVEARVEGSSPGLIVLSDQLAPGWTADVDGTAAPIVATNVLARGVWVAGGHHLVTFRYRTPGLLEGCAVALGLTAFIAGWAVLRRRGRAGAESRQGGSPDWGCGTSQG